MKPNLVATFIPLLQPGRNRLVAHYERHYTGPWSQLLAGDIELALCDLFGRARRADDAFPSGPVGRGEVARVDQRYFVLGRPQRQGAWEPRRSGPATEQPTWQRKTIPPSQPDAEADPHQHPELLANPAAAADDLSNTRPNAGAHAHAGRNANRHPCTWTHPHVNTDTNASAHPDSNAHPSTDAATHPGADTDTALRRTKVELQATGVR
jgi:hypothetical protein